MLQYDADARMIVVDVKKPKGDRQNDLTQMAYYMEKDVILYSIFILFLVFKLFAFGLKRPRRLTRVFAPLQVKVLPLFKNPLKFAPTVNGQNVEMETILVYYVDEEPPTFTMKHLSGGIIAVIVVVVLAVVAGLLVLVSARLLEWLSVYIFFHSP